MKLRLLNLVGVLRGDRRGGVAILFSLALLPMMGICGLVLDYTSMIRQRTVLQNAADAGALSAAGELHLAQVGSGGVVVNMAQTYANATLSSLSSQVSNVVVNVTLLNNNSSVQVSISADYAATFFKTPTTISAQATASAMGIPVCALALDPSVLGIATLWLQANAKMTAQSCAVQSNSPDPIGITAANASQLTAGSICSSGGYFGPRANFSPTPVQDCPPIPDPLASRAPPPVGACDYTNLVIGVGTVALLPGTYCGGLYVTGGAIVTLTTGVYVMQAGQLKVDQGSTLNGQGAGVYFTGAGATISFAAASNINMTAPTNGPMAGLLFFEDRTVTVNQLHQISSDNASVLLGTIYLPQGRLLVDANSPVGQQSAFTIIVARRIALQAGPTLVLNSNYGATTVPVPNGLNPGVPYLTQ